MTRAELKQEAKNTLRGRWGTAIAMFLVYTLIIGAFSMVANYIPIVGSIAVIVISVPLSFGFIGQILKFTRNEDVKYFDFFTLGFNNFSKSWSIYGRTLLKLLPYLIGFAVCYVLLAIMTVVFMGAVFVGVADAFSNSSSNAEVVSTILEGSFNAGMIIIPIVGIATFVLSILLTIKSYYYVLTEYIGNDNLEMTAQDVVQRSEDLMKGHRWEYFVLNLSFIGWSILAMFTCGIGYLWLVPYMEVTMIKFYESLLNNTNQAGE